MMNAVILISCVSITFQVFRDTGIHPKSPLKIRFLSGLIWGVLGILLILFGVHVTPSVLMDFRNGAMILSAVTGGWLSVLVTGVVIALFRIFYYGLTPSSLAAAGVLFGLIIGTSWISHRRMVMWKKWAAMVLWSLVLSGIAFYYVIPSHKAFLGVLANYGAGTLLMCLLLYFYTRFLASDGRLYRRLKVEASKDFLTGLDNLRQFDKSFKDIAAQAVEKSESLSLFFIDVDFFKTVNDTYGHVTGNIVLKTLGEIMLEICRKNDIICRIGGEEFSVLLRDCDPKRAQAIAERLRLAVENHPFQTSGGESLTVTISIGIASYPDTTPEPGKLIEQADNALYQAKRNGRNKVVISQMY